MTKQLVYEINRLYYVQINHYYIHAHCNVGYINREYLLTYEVLKTNKQVSAKIL